MKHGSELFKRWMDRQGLSQRQTAELLEWDETFISKLIRQHRNPGLTNALKIKRLTDIPVEAWTAEADTRQDESSHVVAATGRKRK
jgi:plasmid maintenance system antidote protein VapI